MSSATDFTPQEYRAVMGNLPTGVVVVSAIDETGAHRAMTIGSFGSVSLDPPLVMFMPSVSSNSWQTLQNSPNGYCINVLSSAQQGASLAVAKHRELSELDWHLGPTGIPRLDDCLAYIECDPVSITPAGDHVIVMCAVRSIDSGTTGDPLVFFRGGFGSFRPRSLVSADEFVWRTLRPVGMAREEIADLAERLDAFVTLTQRVGNDLVPVASAGDPRERRSTTQIGSRLPFKAPLGAAAAAWASPDEQNAWLDSLSPELRDEYRSVLDDIRAKGYAFTVAVGRTELELLVDRISGGAEVSEHEIDAVLNSLAPMHKPLELDARSAHDVRAILVPVFDKEGKAALTLAAWCSFSSLRWDEVTDRIAAAQESAAAISALMAQEPPA